MACDKIEVDVDQLHMGARRCGDAAETARNGANQFGAKGPSAGIFGDFAEAADFHATVTASHQGHVDLLHSHHEALSDIGEKGHAAGRRFLAADESGADTIGAARSQIEAP